MRRFDRWLPFFLLLASASLFYIPLGSHALWNSDEGRYAEIAREMLESGNWISPHLNYVLYFEKPPLMYWLTAASFAVFGQTDFAARFWCATFGLLTVAIIYLFGKEWKSDRAGLLSGAILASSILFFALTQFLVLDMALTFWLTLSLYASSRMLMERSPDRVKRYTDLFALAVAGGFLTKGLIGLVFPLSGLVLAIVYTRSWSQARKISWQPALVLALVVAGPWFVLVSLKHSSFPYYFFVREHMERFLTPLHHRQAPFYFFVPVLLAGFLPWSVYLPKVLASSFENRGVHMKRDPVQALLVLWSLFVLVFFSFSQSKLVAYILPVLPALALLVGALFEDVLELPDVPRWLDRGVTSLVLLYAAALCVLKLPFKGALFLDPVAQLLLGQSDVLALMLGFNVFVLLGCRAIRQSAVTWGGILITQVLMLCTLMSVSGVLDPYLSNKGLARLLIQRAEPIERIASYGISYENVLQALPFYSKRRVTVLGDAGELAMGAELSADAADWFSPETEAKAALGRLPAGTWVVTNEEYLKGLGATGVAQTLVPAGREGRLILLHKVR